VALGTGVRNIRDVSERQLCTGCGVCAYLSPDEIRMVDALQYGRRPWIEGGVPRDPRSAEAFEACPGPGLAHGAELDAPGVIEALRPGWGPVLELWEGFAADPGLRFEGSSGGAATAIALHCLEEGAMHGVLHTAARRDAPYLNETVLSTERAQLLAATGSRYAPASPCDGLQEIEDAPRACVFIGKPCDVAAAGKAASLRPALAEKLGLTIAMFCAGTPSTRGTLDMLRRMGVDELSNVTEVRYRGKGWPGLARVHEKTEEGERVHTLTYQESWGMLQRYRQWRCYVCADHTGQFADIAVGDPWYRAIPDGEPGRSLVLVRSERGRRVLESARESGALVLERVEPGILPASQPNLLQTRGTIWARIWTSRLLGAAAPRFEGMPTFRYWWRHLGWKDKAQSVYGTAKRVFTKKLRERHRFEPYRPGEPTERG